MIPKDFPESNGGLGPPKDWDEEKEGGPCGYLHTHHDGRRWVSCWTPSEEELSILKNGGSIYLDVLSGQLPQPAVCLYAAHEMYVEDKG